MVGKRPLVNECFTSGGEVGGGIRRSLTRDPDALGPKREKNGITKSETERREGLSRWKVSFGNPVGGCAIKGRWLENREI